LYTVTGITKKPEGKENGLPEFSVLTLAADR